MAKRGHSEEEILRILREAESGETTVEVCPKRGISQQSLYLWKKRYEGLGLNDSVPSVEMRRAVFGASPSSTLIAPLVWLRAFNSRT